MPPRATRASKKAATDDADPAPPTTKKASARKAPVAKDADAPPPPPPKRAATTRKAAPVKQEEASPPSPPKRASRRASGVAAEAAPVAASPPRRGRAAKKADEAPPPEPEPEAKPPPKRAPARGRRGGAADAEEEEAPVAEPAPTADPPACRGRRAAGQVEVVVAAEPVTVAPPPAVKRGRGAKAAAESVAPAPAEPAPRAASPPAEPAPKRARGDDDGVELMEADAAPAPAPPAAAWPSPTGRGRGRGAPPPSRGRGGRGPPPGRGRGRRGAPPADDGADGAAYRPTAAALDAAEVARDPLTTLADSTWSDALLSAGTAPPFDPAVVTRLWGEVLGGGGGGRPPPRKRVAVLELSRCLENYVAPHTPPDAAAVPYAHTMLAAALIVEKEEEGVPPWTAFDGDADDGPRAAALASLFAAAARLADPAAAATIAAPSVIALWERALLLRFFGAAFASLEHPRVRSAALRLVGLPLWRALSPGRLELELAATPALAKHWRKLVKKDGKAAAEGRAPPPEHAALPALVDEWLAVATSAPPTPDAATDDYLARGASLWRDLLAQLPTRRFVRAVLDDRGVIARARAAPPVSSRPTSRLARLVDAVAAVADFPVDDHTGEAVTDDARSARALADGAALQRLLFRHHPAARDLALAPAVSVCTPSKLAEGLAQLPDAEVAALVVSEARRVRPDDPRASDRPALIAALAAAYELKPGPAAALADMPLYPTEAALLDGDAVPADGRGGRADDAPLPLPRLNLQFLTPLDYLLRNFHLYRLEAAADIRGDVLDAASRLAPGVDEAGRPVFRGWARMAARVASFAVTEVTLPRVGYDHPASVTAELGLTLAGARGDVAAEWDSLRPHDVVFLLSLAPPSNAPDATPAQRSGLLAVRGAEVVEVRGPDGLPMDDGRGFGPPQPRRRPDPTAPPPTDAAARTLVLALDAPQYQADMEALARAAAAGAPAGDVYSSFNVILRRRAKENNFKAVLAAVRGAALDNAPLPPWLRDAFLGYGDPAAATPVGVAAAAAAETAGDAATTTTITLDLRDALLDEAHVSDAFPGAVVEWGGAATRRVPPFRVTLPSTYGAAGDAAPTRVVVHPYTPPPSGPFPGDAPPGNRVRFTPAQVAAIASGLRPGLTQVVGPPGTGKTDVAVQLLATLHASAPGERTLLITHSNAALNDLFEKLVARDVPAGRLLRLGAGEADLAAADDFSRGGRVDALLARRLELLAEAERVARCLGVPAAAFGGGDGGGAPTCAAAEGLFALHVRPAWLKFKAARKAAGDGGALPPFPFASYFETGGRGALFSGDAAADAATADTAWRSVRSLFTELADLRPLELLKSAAARVRYLLTTQARIVAMTCTHAAIKRAEFLELGLK